MNDGEDPRSEDADDAKPAHEAGEQDGTPGAEGAGTEEPTGKQKKSLFKKPVFWIILVIVVAAIAIGAFGRRQASMRTLPHRPKTVD